MELLNKIAYELSIVIVSLMIYFFIFGTVFALSNMLIGTEFTVVNHALFGAIAWSAYKIIR